MPWVRDEIATSAPANQIAAAQCPADGKRMARVELLFGATTEKGAISEKAWVAFLAEEVTPRFPDGLTAYSGFGQWRRPDGQIAKIPTRILQVWYVPGEDAERKIEEIRTAYKEKFEQLSVMRVDGEDCVSF